MDELALAISEKLMQCPATKAALAGQPPEVIANLQRSWASIVDRELFNTPEDPKPGDPKSPWQVIRVKKKNGGK